MATGGVFVELVCGLPGSGKTCYCEGKRQFVDTFYRKDRRVVLINLDPANDGQFPYPCDIDVAQLIQRDVVMAAETLGPNGSYLFCIDYIAERVDWLVAEMQAAVDVHARSPQQAQPLWFLVDCPGQVEFYVHSEGLRSIVRAVTKAFRATTVMTHLCDAVIATRDIPTYVSTCLLCLSCMVDLELPHVNVLTKWDCILAEDDGDEARAPFLDTANFLDDHFNRLWAEHARERGAAPMHPRLKAMAKSLMEVVDGYSLVGFECLDVQSETLMRSVCDRIDMAAGHVS